MNPPAAKLRRVSKSFGQGPARVQALQDVDLDLQAGELTLIEGPSGSGKTTLLHLLGLLQRADAGEVWIGDQRMDGLPESRLPDERAAGVALIFQGYNLLDALTAADNVALADLLRRRRAGRSSATASEPRPSGRAAHREGEAPAEPDGTSCLLRSRHATPPVPHREGEAPAEPCSAPTSAAGGGRYLARFGLAHRAASLPAELSGGEKQRVAIARALASPGRLVLADEPTANLDWTNAQQVVRYLADLAHAEGRAVVMVSHDSRLEPFADRIVGLLNGQISSDRRQEGRTMPGIDNFASHDEEPRPELVPTKSGGRAAPREDETPAEPVASAPRGRREREGDALTEPVTADVLGRREIAADCRGGGPPGSPRRGGATILWLCVIVLLAIIAATVHRHFWPLSEPSEPLPAPLPPSPYVAAAPAVVEPGTQLVTLRSERQGRIKSILKHAGERIRQGEPLVLLDDATTKALVEKRRADLRLAEATLTQLRAWDRPEVRAKAKAGVDQAQARLDRAERELARIQKLYKSSAAGETELNAAVEEQRQAAGALEEARQVHAMSEAGPSTTEIGVAEARVEQASASLRMAEAELSLRTIISPLDGHVIYRHLEPGEVVDPESPVPILSLGNLDDIRLRAEVDEADIERVFVGQRIVATAAAYGDRLLVGRVIHLEPLMGRKTIRTERTTEQQDTKVREVLIELDAGRPSLPIDLQMTVRFLAAPTTADTN